MPGMIPARYTIIIPVKPVGIGKSRLRASIATVVSRPAEAATGRVAVADRIVAALALDTVAAALTVARVLVVTNDAALRDGAGALGAEVVPDAPDAGLNAAITHGEALLGLA